MATLTGAYTELSAGYATGMRKRIPLRNSFIEAFPEETPVLTMMPKKTGCRTTSPDSNSTKVEVPFKTFRKGRNRPIGDASDVDSTESEDNDANKTMITCRIQKIRSVVFTGDIAQAVVQQEGGVTNKHLDSKLDALRGMRTDKELILTSDADSVAQAANIPYSTRGFASWCRTVDHADLPIPSIAKIPAASLLTIAADNADNFKEIMLRNLLQSCWDVRRTKGKWKMFCTSNLQTSIDDWLVFGDDTNSVEPIRRYNDDVSKGTITLSVRSWKGSFGQVDMTPKHDLPGVNTESVTTVNTSATLTVADNTNGSWMPGLPVVGAGIPAGTRVLTIPSNSTTTVTLSAAATASATVNVTVGQPVYAELMDFEFLMLGYVKEVGWSELEDRGGGPRGYADALFFEANLNPQAHALVKQTLAGF